MANLRNPPLFLRASVVRGLIGDVHTLAKGFAQVPVLPVKLVDRPRRSEDPRLAKANDDFRPEVAHQEARSDQESEALTAESAPPVSSAGCDPLAGSNPAPANPSIEHEPATAGQLRRAERNQRIAAAYAAGAGCAEIGQREGLSAGRVLVIANAEGVPSRPAVKRRRLSDLDRRAVADLYATGMPLRAVADRFGVSKSTAQACLIELGAPLRPRGKRSPSYQPKPPKPAAESPAPVNGFDRMWARSSAAPRTASAVQTEHESAANCLSKGAGAGLLTPAPEGSIGEVAGGCIVSPENAGEQHESPPPAGVRVAGGGDLSDSPEAPRASKTGREESRDIGRAIHAQQTAKAQWDNAERAAARTKAAATRAADEEAAIDEFQAALAKVRARKAEAVEVLAPERTAPQDYGARIARAFAAKAAAKSTSVPVPAKPLEPAPGREECPRCGVPGWKGCDHFLPCLDQPRKVELADEDGRTAANKLKGNPCGRLTPVQRFTGKRQGIGASRL